MANLYWVGGTGDWSDTAHWAASTGGGSGADVPTSLDDVFIDSNSGFGSGGTITIDGVSGPQMKNFLCNSGHNYTLDGNTFFFDIYGSLTLEGGITLVDVSGFDFYSTSNGNTITTNGIIPTSFEFYGNGGEWTLQDDMETSGNFYQENGTFDANNHNVTASDYYFYADTGYTPTVVMGSGTWEATGNDENNYPWHIEQYNGEAVTITPETSTIKLTDESEFSKSFYFYDGTIAGEILTVEIANGGSGYTVDEFVAVDGGTSYGEIIVTSVESGVVTGIAITEAGGGYSVANGVTTTSDGGSGLTINILSVQDNPETGKTYNNLWLTGAGTGFFNILGSNTFNELKVDTPPHIIRIQGDGTQIVSTFNVNGSAGNLVTINSDPLSGGNMVSISVNNGGSGYVVNEIVFVDYYENGANQAIVKVTSVNEGVVTGVSIYDAGYGFLSTLSNISTTSITGSGVGLTINIDTISGYLQHILSKSSGIVECDYLDISNSNVTGGATWIATNSIDSGNNTGWQFPVNTTLTLINAGAITLLTSTITGDANSTLSPLALITTLSAMSIVGDANSTLDLINAGSVTATTPTITGGLGVDTTLSLINAGSVTVTTPTITEGLGVDTTFDLVEAGSVTIPEITVGLGMRVFLEALALSTSLYEPTISVERNWGQQGEQETTWTPANTVTTTWTPVSNNNITWTPVVDTLKQS